MRRGRTSIPCPSSKFAGPIWSRNIKGPTIWRVVWGRMRLTQNPPRSLGRGVMIASIEFLSINPIGVSYLV